MSSYCIVTSLTLLLWAAVATTASHSGSGERWSLDDVQDDIDEFVRSTMSAAAIPGLSLAIVSGDERSTVGYGVVTLNATGAANNVSADTLFYAASTSKAFTATLLAQLAKNNSLTLDTPVKQLLPDFSLSEYYRQEHASLVDLVAHRLGVPESLYNWLLGEVTTRRDLVSRSLYFNPSEPFRGAEVYSNLFYTAAGLVTEQLSGGESWEDSVRRHIFQPLRMINSSFMDQLTDEQLALLATPHEPDWRNNNTLREISMEFYKHAGVGGPSGSIVASARDLAKWLYMLTHEGLTETGQRVFDADVLVDSMTAHIVSWPPSGSEPFISTEINYGLGWYTGFYRGYRMATHGGYMFGYHSKVTVIPGQQLGVFTCMNGQAIGFDGQTDIHDYIIDLLLPAGNTTASSAYAANAFEHPSLHHHHHHHQQQQQQQQQQDQQQQYSDVNITELALDEFAGVYGNFAYGNATVEHDSNADELRVRYGDLLVADLSRVAADRFVAIARDPLWFFPPFELAFERADAAVVNVTVPIMLPQDPPVFVRGLRMDQAPPPPVCDCQPTISFAFRAATSSTPLLTVTCLLILLYPSRL